MSSAYYKNHWSYNKFKSYFNSMMKGKKYFLCDLSYQLTILEGLRLKEEVLDEMSEEDFDEYKWMMEMEGTWLGAVEDAYFNFEELQLNRTLPAPIYPKPFYDLVKDGSFKYPRKLSEKGELRILSCDIATMGGKDNDASVFSVFQINPNKKNKYDRKIIYMETMSGGHSTLQAIQIRRLFEDLDCDYIVLDTNGVGMSIYDQLCQNLYDKERQKKYDAISCINDEKMADRCLVSNAPKKIFSVKANQQFNSDCAISLKDNFRRKKIEMLIPENDAKQVIENIKGYSKLPIETQVKFLAPYLQITAFINETINLQAEINKDTGLVKLKEPRSKRKDRYSSVSYGNYFINLLERDLQDDNSDFDWSSLRSCVTKVSF
ncbi:hypothetical protein [Clostridium botulinum]|uniref:hypothetical protein n=1 Tax=Clostridium botulinum TaxID=1491 RepID=UPI00174DA76B|nr:hypothetical protein [Clostridium botulinum]MBD5589181.1 hypothetical protein [Clostridium botulinum]